MKIKEVLKELEHILAEYGDIEIQLQSKAKSDGYVFDHVCFFMVVEEQGTVCNIRPWPWR